MRLQAFTFLFVTAPLLTLNVSHLAPFHAHPAADSQALRRFRPPPQSHSARTARHHLASSSHAPPYGLQVLNIVMCASAVLSLLAFLCLSPRYRRQDAAAADKAATN